MEKEVLRLFKSYLGEKSESFSKEGLKYGLLIPDTANENIIKEAIKQYGKDGEKWNQTFHKDFEIVKNAPIEDLIAQQLIHYMTTYGFESLGFYDQDLVYLPKEKLEIPELVVDSIELLPIRPITEKELTEKLMILLTSGIALSKQTISDIMVLSDYINKDRFDEIVNREIKTTLYDKYNIMPRNPEEFLRYLIFKTTGETLKIQNVAMFKKINATDRSKVLSMINSYINKTPNGYEKLSSIFLRNKKIFLAFKVDKNDKNNQSYKIEMNRIINKLRKLAINNHKPLNKNILDCLTDKNLNVNLNELPNMLNDITIFREIRILNGISYRLYGSNNIVHRIRNGKSYVRVLENKTSDEVSRLENLYKIVYNHLINRLSHKVANKTIYIPSNITYAAPTSEKQFNGNIPDGSYLEIPRTEHMVYGIHWTNLLTSKKSSNRFYGEEDSIVTSTERVDLDLKQMNKSEVFGWDASYRSSTSDILFSGDMTDAPLPNGATELFYVGQNYGYGAFLVTLNNFTQNNADVPFEFMIAKATHRPEYRTNYVVDPNNILEKVDMVVEKDNYQKTVGFIVIGDTIKFYFNDFSQGAQRTSRQDNVTMGTFDYLQSYSKVQLKLNDLLKDAGAILTDKETVFKAVVKEIVDENGNVKESTTEEKEFPVDYNLSTNSITKETLIDLLS